MPRVSCHGMLDEASCWLSRRARASNGCTPSASVVWDALAEPRTQDDLVDDVAAIVGQAPDQVRQTG